MQGSCELPRPLADPARKTLPFKARDGSPDGSGKRLQRTDVSDSDDAPARPYKRATPRVNSASSLIYTPDNGTVLTRKLVGSDATREASFFETYFSDTRRLGKGSYGKVFSATYTLDAKRYAVKVFEDVKEDCSNELMQASVLLQQPHPNCLVYYCAWMDKGHQQFALVTELCSQGSLKGLLRRRALEEHEIWDYFLDVLHGLNHIHERNLRHFDVKPENLLLTDHGHLCVGDFGVASPVGSTMELSRGTKPYQAPEAVTAVSVAELTTAVDVYSLGVVLYEMVTDYDVQVEAREWQLPPPNRQFAVLTNLCLELRDPKPYRRPTVAALLARPEIAERSAQRIAQVRATWPTPAPFPVPQGLTDVVMENGVSLTSARTRRASPVSPGIARNLFG